MTELPPKEQRFALLIGVAEYQKYSGIKTLKGPLNDIDLMSNVLVGRLGFLPGNIKVLRSDSPDENEKPTARNILTLFQYEIRPKLAGGLLVVAFSGHGITKSNVPMLLTYESVLQSARLLQDLALPVSKLKGMLETGDASQVILFIDACQDDPDEGNALSPGNPMTQQFVAAMRLRSTNTLKASLTFFATRPPLRAYINTSEQGYFTEAIADTLNGAFVSGRVKPLSLSTFVDAVQTQVQQETHHTQFPQPQIVGYDPQRVLLLDQTKDARPPASVPRTIKIRQTGTIDDCARLPETARLTVRVAGVTKQILPPFRCDVPFNLPVPSPGAQAYVAVERSLNVAQDNAADGFAVDSGTWVVKVHYTGPATRISAIGFGALAGAKFDYATLLNDRVNSAAGLLFSLDDLRYTRNLALASADLPLNSSFADKLDYLNQTNSAEILWGERSRDGGTLHLHAFLRASNDTATIVSADVRLDAYKQAEDVTTSLVLLGLLRDAEHSRNSAAASILRTYAVQSLKQVPTTGSDLDHIRTELEAQLLPHP